MSGVRLTCWRCLAPFRGLTEDEQDAVLAQFREILESAKAAHESGKDVDAAFRDARAAFQQYVSKLTEIPTDSVQFHPRLRVETRKGVVFWCPQCRAQTRPEAS